MYLKVIIAEKIQIINQTKISKGQWTHAMILEIDIQSIKGNKIQNNFLYHAKKRAVKKANATVAWSDGNEASGTCFNSNFQVQCI